MADKKISQMTSITASQIANNDNIVIADVSENHTKRAEISELATFFGVNQEGIQDTVGAMFTGHSSHAGITPVYDDPNGHLIFSLAGGVTTAEMGHLAGTTSDIQTQFNSKSPIASPTFTGTASAPTPSANDNTTKISTTAYVQGELTAYASDSATFTNKGGAISQWTNDSGYITPSSTSTLTNKTGSISQWTNNSGYITGSSTEALSNKSISGSANTLTNIPYTALSSVDEDITSVSSSHDTIASAKAIKTYVDAQISGIDTLEEAGDTSISSPSAGQVLVHDGSNSFDNKTVSVSLTGAVSGTANMSSTGAVSVATTIPTNTITINGQAVALGGSATIPSVLQSGGTFTGELHLNDNVKLSLGGASGSGDLEIYHDTSDSIIKDGGTGALEIRTNELKIKNSAGNENGIYFAENGAVNLYYDNSKKLETTSGGVAITGTMSTTSDINQAGGDYVYSGGGNFDIKHNIASQNITFYTTPSGGTATERMRVTHDGNLVVNGTISTGGSTLSTVATSGAYSDLSGTPSLSTVATSGSYNDLSNKPTIPTNNNTLTNGAGYLTDLVNDTTPQLGGALDVNGHSISFGDNEKARFGNSDDFSIFHAGNQTILDDSGTGSVELRTNAFTVAKVGGAETIATFTQDGSVNLYYDNTDRARTTSSGFAVTGELTCTGNLTSSNNVSAYSDIRLKKDIKTIDNALDKVSQMRGVTFTKDDAKGSGVIAQELEKIAPELVVDGEYKSVAYGNTVGYLIEAIKELKAEIEELKKG